jgi:KDEL-tailed cysteine endopeptidase
MIRIKPIILALAVTQLVALTAFADLNEDTTFITRDYGVKHAKGLVRTVKSKAFFTAAPKTSFVGAPETVPGTYSIRDKAGPVEDQGQCGSCWDFSLTSTLRGTWIMAGKDPGRLSFNYLLNCATTMDGCDGGDFPAADLFINPKGAPAYGSDGTYTAGNSGKAGKCVSKAVVSSTTDYKMLGTGGVPSFQDIAYVVGVLHRPVSIDIAAGDSFQSYGGGTFNDCSETEIDHMVVIEGYSCEKSVNKDGSCKFDAKGNLPAGTGTWLIRNSWGTSWGDSGYITMKATDSKGAKCSAVATDALYYDVQ